MLYDRCSHRNNYYFLVLNLNAWNMLISGKGEGSMANVDWEKYLLKAKQW